MKLRLVREDGSDATLDDLCAARATSVEIDGVDCLLAEYEGTDAQEDAWRASEAHGDLRLTLSYSNRTRAVTDRAHTRGRAFTAFEYDCAFSRARRRREAVR